MPHRHRDGLPLQGRHHGLLVGADQGTVEDGNRDLAWSYEFPTASLLPIAGLVAFYNEKVDLFVDGVRQGRPHTHLVR